MHLMQKMKTSTLNFSQLLGVRCSLSGAASFGTSSGPDVVMMHNTDIPNFASKKMLANLDELKEELGIKPSDYPESVLEGKLLSGSPIRHSSRFSPHGSLQKCRSF